MFPRQSGKNELQAQLETYLLTLLSQTNAEMVKISPTWRPQTLNAMRRLHRVLERNILVKNSWYKEQGYIYRIGSARIYFFSGQPESNIVGATASTLLKHRRGPGCAAREVRQGYCPHGCIYQRHPGILGYRLDQPDVAWPVSSVPPGLQKRKTARRRVFVMTADDVAREVPAYRKFVNEQIAKLGRTHPLIKTQYFSEEIDAEGGMFPQERIALMQGNTSPSCSPPPAGCTP